ncbi:MAG TPA: KUP/HAK/KT family potassium transporter, partial [Novosphingobium sp.]
MSEAAVPDQSGAATATDSSAVARDGSGPGHGHHHGGLLKLAVGAIGVVFGDIGTSPLYAFSVTLKAANPAGTAPAETILGIVSL